jgi:hypothetical protein
VGTSLLASCEHPIPRDKVSDFFAKDFELPDYRADEDHLSRERHRLQVTESMPGSTVPSQKRDSTSAALAAAELGDAAGAYVGGFGNAWRASAVAALGDPGGASAAAALSHATHDDPLPRDYTGLELGVPVILVDPNAGITFGVMPISLFREGDRITNTLNPTIQLYNEIEGQGIHIHMKREYRTDTRLEIDAGSTVNGAHDYDFQYRQGEIGPYHVLFFRGRARYVTDLTNRFYGLGNDSDRSDEANYTLRRAEGLAAIGIDPTPISNFVPIKLEFAELISTTKIGPPHIKGLPSARSEFPDVAGMHDRIDLLSHRFTFTVDTRDRPNAPTNGFLLEGYYEIGDSTLASDFAFAKGGVTVQGVVSYLDDIFATAGRFTVRFVGGRHVPFYEQTSVGGKTDQTSITGKISLRGFGDGRFIDKNGFSLGIEERWNLVHRLQDNVNWLLGKFPFLDEGKRYVSNNAVLQLAFFAECGRVFSGGQTFNFRSLKTDVGPAVRLVLPETDLVLSIDVGVSGEGVNPFVDLGYTF